MNVLYHGADIIDYFIASCVHVLFPQIVARLLMKLVWVPSMEGNAQNQRFSYGTYHRLRAVFVEADVFSGGLLRRRLQASWVSVLVEGADRVLLSMRWSEVLKSILVQRFLKT